MIGILVQLLVSWLLVKWVLNENLDFLGWKPGGQRISDFFLFLLVSMACAASQYLMRIHFGNEQWELNPALNIRLLAEGAWWNLKSVSFEELIFRGALFYILIKKTGPRTALLVSAAAFGIYHWFSYNALGNVPQMVQLFFITGIIGLLYGWAYLKTRSLYAVVAMHFGWNFTNNFLFSNGNIGKGVFIEMLPAPMVTVSKAVYYLVAAGPMVAFFLFNFVLLWRKKKGFFGNDFLPVKDPA